MSNDERLVRILIEMLNDVIASGHLRKKHAIKTLAALERIVQPRYQVSTCITAVFNSRPEKFPAVTIGDLTMDEATKHIEKNNEIWEKSWRGLAGLSKDKLPGPEGGKMTRCAANFKEGIVGTLEVTLTKDAQ